MLEITVKFTTIIVWKSKKVYTKKGWGEGGGLSMW
jgi:hypothetical protein